MPNTETGEIEKSPITDESKYHRHEKQEPFPYQTIEANVKELAEANTVNPEVLNKLDALGLEDFHFEVHTRINRPTEKRVGPEDKITPNIYVLLHGWTGNHSIFTNVKNENGLTMVEEILLRDPDAIIITPDGNGFGGTKFKPELNSLDERINLSTPQAYADQIEFLLKDIFQFDEITLEQVRVAGHSMGGACAYEMARRGYEAVAIAPAALPVVEELKDIHDLFPKSVKTGTLDNLQDSVRSVYLGLGFSNQLAHFARERTNIPSEKIVQAVFEKILSGYLMGYDTPGNLDKTINRQIIDQLTNIHSEELTAEKLATVAATMFALAQGVSVTKWTNEDIKTMGNNVQAVFLGERDTLVKKKDGPDFQKVLAAQLLKTEDVNVQREGADLSRSLSGVTEVIKNAGHYSTLYHPQVIEAIVKPTKAEIKYGSAKVNGNLESITAF
jgi:pimeloyl-ACP methyl ester carboxylesterase